MRTRVKICGLTCVDDVNAAVQAGADAIGLVFYPGSKRAVTIEQARLLRAKVPAFVSVAALFVNAAPTDVQAVIDRVQPDVLQFHGDETPDYCRQFGRRYMRAFRMGGPGMDSAAKVLAEAQQYPDAAGWLFDTYSAGYGGSGEVFDHGLLADVLASEQSQPVILAGGLNDALMANTLRQVRPYAVDVSSGVETAPGVKSGDKIRAFIRAVRKADQLANTGDAL